ncbi:MAG: hypothetical protein V4534_06810 [Myxococcota bacterium]
MKYAFICLLSLVSSCMGLDEGDPIPMDRLYAPASMLKNGDTLYVVNANLDLRYKTGSVLGINVSDTTAAKVTETAKIPSQGGILAASSDFESIFVTSQQLGSLNSLKPEQQLDLGQNGPYFLSLVPNQQAGFIGYLLTFASELIDDGRFSVTGNQGELQYFTWAPGQPPQVKQTFKISSCFKAQAYQRTARLGGLLINNGNLFALAEIIVTPGYRPQKRVFLVKAAVSDLQQGNLNQTTCKTVDLTQGENGGVQSLAQAGRGLAVSTDGNTVYALLDENPTVLRLGFGSDGAVSQTAKVETCRSPVQIRLSPDEKTVLVACDKSHQLIAYNAPNLGVIGKFQGGTTSERNDLGPVDILFDPLKPSQVFVSFQGSHQIGIFNYANTTSSQSFDFVSRLKLSR